jgi:tetratricopeptide (TPR) repeat protein
MGSNGLSDIGTEAHHSVPAAVTATSPAVPKCLGRSSAIDELEKILDAAARGRGGLALITGEAGIGRTTLALEIADRAMARDITVHWSACWTQPAAPAYWPWSQLIEDHLPGVAAADLPELVATIGRALATVAPGVAGQLGISSAEPPIDDAFELFHIVARFWAKAATRLNPLLLIVDDLQWADPPSVYLLAHVAATLRRAPVAVMATMRTGEAFDDALSGALAELDRCAPNVVPLKGLPKTALADLARAFGLPPDAAVIDLLARRTAGNPFFATELLRMLDPATDSYSPFDALANDVPRHVAQAIRRRLAQLEPRVLGLLRAASVLGPVGDVRVLATIAGLDFDPMAELLDVSADAGLLGYDGRTSWRFIHTLVRDVVYQSLTAPLRRQLHERALTALEAVAAPPSQLAWHAQYTVELGRLPHAVALMVEAGSEQVGRHAYGEAVECFARAVELGATEAGTPAQVRRLLLLADARGYLADTIAARAAFRVAAQAAGLDPDLLGAAALGFADPMVGLETLRQDTDGETIDLLRQALDTTGDAETPLRVRLLARLGVELVDTGEHDQAKSTVSQALAMAHRVSDPVAALSAMAAHHGLPGSGAVPLGAALAESAQILRLAEDAGNLRSLHAAHRARIVDLVMAGDLSAVDAELLDIGRVTAELGNIRAHQWWIALWRAMRALLGGRHAEAGAFSAKAWEIAGSMGVQEIEAAWLIQTVFLYREQARLADLEADLRAFVTGTPYSPATDALMALRAAEMGDVDEAADALRRLAGQVDDLRERRDWSGLWFQLARTAYLVGDRDIAATLYEQGRPLSGRCVVVGPGAVCVGAADLALAWLADTLDATLVDDAQLWYASAAAINVRVDARSWLAQTRLDHARLLIRRGDPGDLTAAGRLAELAADAAAHIGLESVLTTAEDLMANTTEPPASPRGPSAGPTDGVGLFRRRGALWELGFGGRSIRLPHAKGLADLASLLAQPGQPMHVSELIALQAPGIFTPSGADDVFDTRARQEIRQRLADLATEVEDAETNVDLARAERARTERAELLAALSSALGLGGRTRRLDDPMERARKTVSARIRSSISRIGTEHAALARHLERSVDTGLWCAYEPEQPISWRT